jgi:prolyl-tRNA synthetase
MRRDALRDGDKVKSASMSREAFVDAASGLLQEIQANLYKEAKARMDAAIRTDITTFDALAAYFAGDDESGEFKGWVRAAWCKPEGTELDEIDEKLKKLKLTLRNAPLNQSGTAGTCIFTGRPGIEEILISRAY